MKPNYTHINFLLDRSGSMSSIKDETITSFNVFIDEQKKLNVGDCTMTIVQFDNQNPHEVICDFVSIKDVKKLDGTIFVPRGCTPLLDAIGQCINETGVRLSKMKEEDRPSVVIFVTMTDGIENASTIFTKDAILSKIKHQTDSYNWKFVYLGANQDAILVASKLGISAGNAMSYAHTGDGVVRAMKATSDGVSMTRLCSGSVKDFYTTHQKQEQENLVDNA